MLHSLAQLHNSATAQNAGRLPKEPVFQDLAPCLGQGTKKAEKAMQTEAFLLSREASASRDATLLLGALLCTHGCNLHTWVQSHSQSPYGRSMGG